MIKFIIIVIMGLMAQGCASIPYEYGKDIEQNNILKLLPQESQIQRGRDNWFCDSLDFLGNFVISLPSKLLLLNLKVDNHNISEDTEEKIRQYLEDNDLNNVKVRLNQYAPGAEYGRLFHNSSMHWGWRYTLGLATVTSYTIFPGRFFGGDNYNPYTNTINLYSGHNGIALHEAAHAKDFAKRKNKGFYAALRMLPIVPLFQEGIATGDTIGYDKEEQNVSDEKEDYKILYPAYSTYIAGEGLRWIPLGYGQSYLITLASTIPGHIIGRVKAGFVKE